jgi:hypothetical protein
MRQAFMPHSKTTRRDSSGHSGQGAFARRSTQGLIQASTRNGLAGKELLMNVIGMMLVFGALVSTPAVAFGQSHGHSHHGGQEVKIGAYEAELVVKGSDVTLYVNDAKDQKVDAAAFSATAVVLGKGNQQKTIELKPAGENKLATKIDFQVEGKFRATVTLKNASGEVGKGRYTVDMGR